MPLGKPMICAFALHIVTSWGRAEVSRSGERGSASGDFPQHGAADQNPPMPLGKPMICATALHIVTSWGRAEVSRSGEKFPALGCLEICLGKLCNSGMYVVVLGTLFFGD
jgi:hypothetical protein